MAPMEILSDTVRLLLRDPDICRWTYSTRTRLGDSEFFRRWTVSLELSACRIT